MASFKLAFVLYSFRPVSQSRKRHTMHEFKLPDMTCGHCKAAVTEALQAVDAQAQITIDLPARLLRVESSQPQAALAVALSEAGYPPA